MGLQCRRAWGIYLTAEQINPKSASDKQRKWKKRCEKVSKKVKQILAKCLRLRFLLADSLAFYFFIFF